MGTRILVLIGFLLSSVSAISQIKADVTIVAIDNSDVVYKMDQAITKTIDEINDAFNSERAPRNPDRNLISDAVFDNILSLWEVNNFRITQTQLVLDGLFLPKRGYQLRNIPIYFVKEAEDSKEREIGFNFDPTGKMVNCFLCLELNTYNDLKYNGNTVIEMTRREIILAFIEKFRTAYNIKDLASIEQVFSENALIIVGTEIRTQAGNSTDKSGIYTNIPQEKVKYTRLSKKEYIANLARAFKANEYLKVEFDKAEIVQSRQYPDIYGVTLRQTWKSTHYNDRGWLFLLIDFRDKDEPRIHVRTWQPDGVAERDLFKIGDFDPG